MRRMLFERLRRRTNSESIAGRDDMPRQRQKLLLTTCAVVAAWGLLQYVPAKGQEPAVTPAPAPLHQRIDALVEAASPSPGAVLADDSEFLRRVYLDLVGTIPDAAQARAFLDDANPSKREALVNQLLASPRFARHMQHTFDSMWLERRRSTLIGKGVADDEWTRYLYQSFLENKPLNELVREILAADGADPKLRAAAKFYLDRDAEPNLLARDVGRLFFGHDLQCAQCHDHPLVDDYLQAEYYGLAAFFTRGSVFTDAKDESKLYYAELAEGEINFKSVFTGNARDRVLPELPDGEPVVEPKLAEAERYVVAPADGVRPVPKYSRRAQLASLATGGNSAAFNRNLANRLWAQMLGRGIVQPLDMQHSGNPAVQSELLDLLAAELVQMKFDIRLFFREVALSKTYQRTSAEPESVKPPVDPGVLSPALTTWQAEVDRLSVDLPKLEETVAAADAAQASVYETHTKALDALAKIEKERGEAKKASDELSAVLAAAIKEVTTKEDVYKTLAAAQAPAEAAVAKLPEDKALADAANTIKTRTAEVEQALTAARATVAEKTPQVQAASVKLAEFDGPLTAATAEVAKTGEAHLAAKATFDAASTAYRAAKAKNNELTARVADATKALNYQALLAAVETSSAATQAAAEQVASLEGQTATMNDTLASARTAVEEARAKADADRAAAEKAWLEIVDRSTTRFAIAPLKPLTPEQLAWATMQAVGMTGVQQQALAEEAKKSAAAAGEMTPEARSALEIRTLEQLVDAKLTGNINHFRDLFGPQPGQAPSFQATVHQALFLANGGVLAAWVNPGGGNLTERLAKLEDPNAVADELYLSVFTRRPTADETKAVTDYWQASGTERSAAVRDMVWSLVTSSEFRFNH